MSTRLTMRGTRRRALTTPGFALISGLYFATLSCGDGGTEPPPPPDPPRPTTVTVSPASATLAALGDSVRFTAQVLDQYGDAMASATVSWSSSDVAVATVNTSGVATAAGDGSATITATSGSASGTATVTVAREASTVVVTPTEAELRPGDTVRFSAQAEDANGFAIEDAVFAWSSSDPAVAVVDSAGLVRAIGRGDATITAAADSATGSATVTVTRTVSTVVVTPTEAELLPGDTVRFSAQAEDANGFAIEDAVFAWSSSDPAVAVVDSAGLVRAIGRGDATITAAADSVTGSATVTVTRTVSTVVVTPTEAELLPGDTVRFSAQAEDANGFAIEDAVFAWSSSDPAVAVVDSAGLVRAIGRGDATITAAADSVTGSATVTVTRTVSTVVVTPTEAELLPGDTVRFSAQAEDANGFAIEDAVFAWSSSDPAVAVVDSAGLVRAIGRGDATITAAADSVTGSATVTVTRTVSTVVVMPSEATVVAGDSVQLSAEARDRNGGDIADASFAWESSDESVATVDTSGLVRAVAEGRVTITATSGTASGSAGLRVAEMSDRGALVAFYRSTGGAEWVDRTNWLTDAPLGDWYGVSTNEGGRVVRLTLVSNNLTGVIPPQIEHLSDLRSLILRDNSIGGGIPQELGNLSRLENLGVGRNSLSGPIPSEVGQLTNLGVLLFSSNRLSGPIPPEIGGLRNLSLLGLESNDLSGELPPELALPRLGSLGVGGNLLQGPIPHSFLQSNLRRFVFTLPQHRNLHLCLPGTPDFVAWIARVDVPHPRYCNASDVAALESLHNSTGGADWMDSDGWLSDPALGEWHGVESDSLGRVAALDLSGNRLSGQLPSQVGRLSAMTELKIGDNPLTGRLPMSLTSVPLREFSYAGTGLCTPANAFFRAWLNTISVHEGTGTECTALTDRDILGLLYRATDGPNWTRSDNWLTDAPLSDWYGVNADGSGRVTALFLVDNNLSGYLPSELGQLTELLSIEFHLNQLTGPIPPALGNLSKLEWLWLTGNLLEGAIPSELGNLTALTGLSMANNPLTGHIPAELGSLPKLEILSLEATGLSGPIPRQLGRLSTLQLLHLNDTYLTGPIPPELGRLSRLQNLALRNNRLTGHIPVELGSLPNLRTLLLESNGLSGHIPRQLGDLTALELLTLGGNDLSGALPASFSRLTNLRRLTLSNNSRMSGVLPRSLQSLGRLETFMTGGTALCAPGDPDFLGWLQTVETRRVLRCPTGERSKAYLTQAVQSLEYPVSLVAGEPALLRVFVTASEATDATIPPVRATFYHDESEVHAVDLPRGSAAIPVEIEEGELAKSANADIPGQLVQPGLEMVIEIDPDGTLDPGLDVQRRIPETGRQAVDVRDMPTMHLTVIPYLWEEEPDSSILEITDGMTARDTLLWATRTFLPVGDLEVAVHDPVWTSTTDAFKIRGEVEALRVMEGKRGYHMGTMKGLTLGIAYLPGWSSVAPPDELVIAHELGHNMYLYHAPCGGAGGPDPSFPSPTGSIGAWGYDFRDGGRLVSAGQKDLMSYCDPQWISDYSFDRALFFRLDQEAEAAAVASVASTQVLLLWGGLDESGAPFLEPAFVVDAPPVFRPLLASIHSPDGAAAAMSCSRSASTRRRSRTAGHRPSRSRFPPGPTGPAVWPASPCPAPAGR